MYHLRIVNGDHQQTEVYMPLHMQYAIGKHAANGTVEDKIKFVDDCTPVAPTPVPSPKN
jgi:hypothetical protein